jgi:transitional endoplasmic reticulum ATPase
MNNNSQDKFISLSDIGGLKKEKSDLTDLLVSSLTNDIPPRGILLHGPKGCGKTMLINAIGHEISATIIRINPSDIYSRHYGESETKLKRLFAQTTVTKKKYLLIVENIESLCPNQERITQQLERRLTTTFIELLDRHLDGKNVFLIATTNRLDSVDSDLRRPGRIDEEIEIGIPNQHDRLEVRKIHELFLYFYVT